MFFNSTQVFYELRIAYILKCRFEMDPFTESKDMDYYSQLVSLVIFVAIQKPT